ncbi:hypothetical protein AwWohl_10870 [Gammaproteobacteria bacterium]|nr:hypothetical protein AwWohl_10870 [Gammaproteobacteria bacterium]
MDLKSICEQRTRSRNRRNSAMLAQVDDPLSIGISWSLYNRDIKAALLPLKALFNGEIIKAVTMIKVKLLSLDKLNLTN